MIERKYQELRDQERLNILNILGEKSRLYAPVNDTQQAKNG